MTAAAASLGSEDGARRRFRQRMGGPLLVIAVTALVGFLLVGQLRGSQQFRLRLESENQGDLTRILAGLSTEADALRDEISTLKLQLLQIQDSQAQDASASATADAQLRALRVLAGTVRVAGPGLMVRINDPETSVAYDTLLDVVAELRDAGAEAVAINDHRVGGSSAFGGTDRQVMLDGVALVAPFTVVAIGLAPTLEGGLKIPGGAIDSLSSLRGVHVELQRSARIEVPALDHPPVFRVGRSGAKP